MEVWPGEPYPLGATYDGTGTNFAIFSGVAQRVELCLFDEAGREERVDLPEHTALTWHGYLPGVGPGKRYGYRIHGPYDPAKGLLCNPHKLIVDPYAKAIDGVVTWDEAVFSYYFDRPTPAIPERNEEDSAPFVPRSVVSNPFFDWRGDRQLRTPWHETIIYEVNVRGFTARHPDLPQHLRGTYAGLAHPSVIEYFKELGVTAVELLPVHQFIHDHTLVKRGLRNYWGYNTLGYFAPHQQYATRSGGQQVQEFKEMVRVLHEANIEVILDVVYNHTCEGNSLGPTLCFRGADNAAYYRLDEADPRKYVDYTGCGNSLNMQTPHVLQLIMDSLRYWIQEMHVDGFRFDLAATLARELHAVDRLSTFFDLIQQDPVVSQVKLIAEPWDIGEGGYQVGNFPPLWSEWNGKYRDAVRDYWRGRDQTLSEFASRLTGSSDLYASSGRRPYASINFVTCHDGFTLRDLVSYNHKHNRLNGEENTDGETHNRSWNCGVEGETRDKGALALRARQQRNFLATLFLSQGVPMLLAGDEIGKTQYGNNNAYCQDNDLSWVDWQKLDLELLAYVRRLIGISREHAVFRRRRWLQGRSIRGDVYHDIGWFRPDGLEMQDDDWETGYAKSLAVYLSGEGIPSRDRRGQPVVDDDFYLAFNAHHEPLTFTIPERFLRPWFAVLDTSISSGEPTSAAGLPRHHPSGSPIEVAERSIVMLRSERVKARIHGEIPSSPSP